MKSHRLQANQLFPAAFLQLLPYAQQILIFIHFTLFLSSPWDWLPEMFQHKNGVKYASVCMTRLNNPGMMENHLLVSFLR